MKQVPVAQDKTARRHLNETHPEPGLRAHQQRGFRQPRIHRVVLHSTASLRGVCGLHRLSPCCELCDPLGDGPLLYRLG